MIVVLFVRVYANDMTVLTYVGFHGSAYVSNLKSLIMKSLSIRHGAAHNLSPEAHEGAMAGRRHLAKAKRDAERD